jgi:hypothetical protein
VPSEHFSKPDSNDRNIIIADPWWQLRWDNAVWAGCKIVGLEDSGSAGRLER